MVDRVDGLTYFLTQTAGGDSPPPVMSLAPANWVQGVFGSLNGPTMETPDGPIRLFVSGGVLSHEIPTGDSVDVSNSIPDTRGTGFQGELYELRAPWDFVRSDPTGDLFLVKIPQTDEAAGDTARVTADLEARITGDGDARVAP